MKFKSFFQIADKRDLAAFLLCFSRGYSRNGRVFARIFAQWARFRANIRAMGAIENAGSLRPCGQSNLVPISISSFTKVSGCE
jgi:hypothetical protein